MTITQPSSSIATEGSLPDNWGTDWTDLMVMEHINARHDGKQIERQKVENKPLSTDRLIQWVVTLASDRWRRRTARRVCDAIGHSRQYGMMPDPRSPSVLAGRSRAGLEPLSWPDMACCSTFAEAA
ncbi:hypothetical protein AcW1_002203 [Taiwanofungus camphoratus]|nr:hypothetical protein AcV5_010197 [Antrodia cinnamomea]KAI0944518.1 hypothetical protein AcW1_002203 [Antrodia cinnamomea]KAI0946177.1 hypothetical protein AcV7_010217 [Antrodia cinnamomea]